MCADFTKYQQIKGSQDKKHLITAVWIPRPADWYKAARHPPEKLRLSVARASRVCWQVYKNLNKEIGGLLRIS
jgi:hypothetical protein